MSTLQEPQKAKQEPRMQTKLTGSQYIESMAIAEIIHREIEYTGSFRAKLSSYAYCFSQSNRFDPHRAEMIIRDQFTDRYGQNMKAMLDKLIEREAEVKENPHSQAQALHHACNIEKNIKEGEGMPYYRAVDKEAITFSRLTRVTESCAKKMMATAYEKEYQKSLYDFGKAVEAESYIPKMEAAKAEREEVKQQHTETQHHNQSM